jgi:DNA polymerase-1
MDGATQPVDLAVHRLWFFSGAAGRAAQVSSTFVHPDTTIQRMPSSRTFYIIDGHAQIYRAYFAPFRDLTSPTGEPTKATFVFTQMLLNLIEQRKPDYLAMVIDEGGDEAVFRKQIYPAYKANRAKRPDDLAPQEQRILQIVRDAGIPVFGKPGLEADDLIATMAKRLCQEDWDVFLVSKDKDLRQILNDRVRMYDVQTDQVFDVHAMIARHGYSPEQAVDVQSLMGDTVDNVPGIPGVGEKTAVKLIQQYGTVDAIVANAAAIKGRLGQSILAHADKLPIARQLVKLRDDVEMDFDPHACAFKGLNVEALRAHLKSLGFNSLLSRLPAPNDTGSPAGKAFAAAAEDPKPFAVSLFADARGQPADAPPPALTSADCQYTLVGDEATFEAFLAQLRQQKRFAFDTETDALGAMQSNLVGMSFSWKASTGWYIPVRGPAGSAHLPVERVLGALRPILEDPSIEKVGHNLKYDLMVMRQAGIDIKGHVLDTMIGAFLLDSGRMQYGIDRLALDLLNFRKIPTVELIGKGRQQLSMDRVELQRIATYASEDADIAWRLSELLGRKLGEVPELKKLNEQVENPLIDVLCEMETNGIRIDPAELKRQSQAVGEHIAALKAQILESAGCDFNPDSPRQLGDVLFNRLGLRPVKKTKTGHSTDVEVLEKLAAEHPVPRLVLDYRSLVKLKNTYLDSLQNYVNPRTGKIHTSFNQTGAATGRLSSSDPNLQNIPIRTDEGRRIRLAFIPGDPENNVLLTADYSQIELRVLAHFTEEPALMRAFAEEQDVHSAVAAEVFGVPLDQVSKAQRAQAKIINFGIIYGVSPFGLARRIEGMSVKAAADLIAAYHKRFPGIKRFLDTCVAHAQTHGYVSTILGRRRPVLDIHSGVIALRNAAERIAINSVVQGSAADLIKVAMINIHRRLKRENRPSRMLLQVHDELVFEIPDSCVEEESDMIRHEMIHAMSLKVPLRVQIGWAKNWQEVK